MSLYYSHLLISQPPGFRPEADAVERFVRGLIDKGTTSAGSRIEFSRVTKGEPRVRELRNPISGDIIRIQGPSRTREQPQELLDPALISTLVGDQEEYDLVLTGTGVPLAPPLIVGHMEDDSWKEVDSPYHLEIRCRVRLTTVRLYLLDSEEEFEGPPDFANTRPKFDEDCLAGDHCDGLSVHPELGVFKVPHSGCGMFWVEFNYGKFVFPRSQGGGVAVLSDSVTGLARREFKCEFVQACNWG